MPQERVEVHHPRCGCNYVYSLDIRSDTERERKERWLATMECPKCRGKRSTDTKYGPRQAREDREVVITHACGCQHTAMLHGTPRANDRKEGWLAGRNCSRLSLMWSRYHRLKETIESREVAAFNRERGRWSQLYPLARDKDFNPVDAPRLLTTTAEILDQDNPPRGIEHKEAWAKLHLLPPGPDGNVGIVDIVRQWQDFVDLYFALARCRELTPQEAREYRDALNVALHERGRSWDYEAPQLPRPVCTSLQMSNLLPQAASEAPQKQPQEASNRMPNQTFGFSLPFSD